MNIEIIVVIDGQQLSLNEELNTTINSIVNSYVKQKISRVKEKKITEKKAKEIRKPHLTEEQKTEIINRAKTLQDVTMSKAARVICDELDRAWSSIYMILKKGVSSGQLTFIKPV